MSNPKKKINLIAEEIIFSNFSISYIVRVDSNIDVSGVVFCVNDICDRDLILNPTYIDKNNKKVCFVVGNVTPHFYKDILDRTIRDFDEYKNELQRIYLPGEVVGYILIE